MGINEEIAAIEQRVKELAEELAAETVSEADEISWVKATAVIDLFRKRIAEYYGFEKEKIIPVRIEKLDDPLFSSFFHVEGISYEVFATKLTCLGEL